nr:hypothetical protein [Tanacetum cinerariifolium]
MRSINTAECLLLKPLVDGNPISGQSLSKHSILEVERTSHQSLEADSGSSPSAYSIPVGPTIPSSQMGLIDKAPVPQVRHQYPEYKAHYESEKEAIYLLLTGIGDEIYSTVDACKTSHEMCIAIERLQQGKQIAKPITPPSESVFEEDSDPEQAQRDKDIQKILALIAKYKNDNQTRQFGNQRTMTIARAKETVGSQVVQQTRIQCFNCKEFGHFAKECRKPKRVKDSTYHKEKMLLCKQAEKEKIQEVPTADSETDTEPLEQVQNDAKYNVFANMRQYSEQPESTSKTCVVEKVDSNVIPDSPDMYDNDIQTDQNAKDECDALANLIANLTHDTEENKKN